MRPAILRPDEATMSMIAVLWLWMGGCVPKHEPPTLDPPPVPDTSEEPPDTTGDTAAGPTNVLVVLLDDIGIDKVRAYHPEEAANMPPQPTLERLSAEGVRFVHTWAQPTCSPTRAALLTGRYPRRHGIGAYIPIGAPIELPLSEITLAEVLRDEGYATGAFGKWHLATPSSPTGLAHPNAQGFDRYAGWIGNIGTSYFDYTYIVDGVELEDPDVAYATTQTVDDAVTWIDEREQAGEPWFAWVATHAVHTPLHEPPPELHDRDLSGDPAMSQVYAAMVQATDAELGRLLDTIGPDVLARTHVVVLGDNGTLGAVMVPPFDPDRDKGTLFEGGVRVPMWVLGPSVPDPGSARTQLFHAVDLLPTVASLLDISPPDALDGVDQTAVLASATAAPARDHMYSDDFKPIGPGPYDALDDRAVREPGYKVMLDALTGEVALYRVSDDHVDEGDRLLQADLTPDDAAALERLTTILEDYGDDVVYGPR